MYGRQDFILWGLYLRYVAKLLGLADFAVHSGVYVSYLDYIWLWRARLFHVAWNITSCNENQVHNYHISGSYICHDKRSDWCFPVALEIRHGEIWFWRNRPELLTDGSTKVYRFYRRKSRSSAEHLHKKICWNLLVRNILTNSAKKQACLVPRISM